MVRGACRGRDGHDEHGNDGEFHLNSFQVEWRSECQAFTLRAACGGEISGRWSAGFIRDAHLPDVIRSPHIPPDVNGYLWTPAGPIWTPFPMKDSVGVDFFIVEMVPGAGLEPARPVKVGGF